jgi:hypothetical protein
MIDEARSSELRQGMVRTVGGGVNMPGKIGNISSLPSQLTNFGVALAKIRNADNSPLLTQLAIFMVLDFIRSSLRAFCHNSMTKRFYGMLNGTAP